MLRIERLEADLRQMTGTIEQLQHRNRQLEAQIRSMGGTPGAQASASGQPGQPLRPAPQAGPSSPPPATVPGRRSDVFDPSQNPNAPGAPHTLGSIPANPPSIVTAEPPVGAPGGRTAGAPLDLSTLATVPAGAAPEAGPPEPSAGGPLPPPPSRNLSATGAVASVAPPTESPKDHYDLAYGYVLRKDYALAENAFQDFLKRFPSDRRAPDAQFWLGESLFQRQRYDAAASAFLDLSTKHASHGKAPEALLRLGAIARGHEAEGNGLRHARRGRTQVSARIQQREAGCRARAEACPLLTAPRRSRPPKCDRCLPISPTIRFSCWPFPAGLTSTALLVLAARWRKARKRGPKLVAVTVDHGLRAQARHEAAAVKRLARSLGVAHRTLRWTGRKPATGLQAAARMARYRLLADAAAAVGARHVLTAHTLDDQAETVLIRLTRGSGISGLAAMARMSPLPVVDRGDVALVRPLLDVPKARLVATLRRAGIAYADDPTNRDPRFTRARLRSVMPALAREGLGPGRLALLARRVRRADEALEAAVAQAAARLAPGPWPEHGADCISGRRLCGIAWRSGAAAARPRHCPGRQRRAGRAWQSLRNFMPN